MDVISLALASYGVVDKAQTLASSAGMLRGAFGPHTADDLFADCFQRAVKRNAKALRIFTEGGTPDGIEVDKEGLRDALVQLQAASFGSDRGEELAARLAPLFVGAVVLPGRVQEDSALFTVLGHVVSNALQDFVSRLASSSDTIHKELSLRASGAAATEREKQDTFRSLTAPQIAEVLEHVRVMAVEVRKSPYLDPEVIQHESEWAGVRNPFRLLKAEDFKDPSVFSDLFEEPEPYDLVRGSDNLILEGGRGCGKSMILRSLQLPVALEIERRRRGLAETPTLQAAGLDYWGVYIKLARGCFDDVKPDGVITESAALQFFQHFFNMELLKAAAEALGKNRDDGLIRVSSQEERNICEQISSLAKPAEDPVQNLRELRALAKNEQRKIRDHLAFHRIGSGGNYDGDLTYVDDFPKEMCDVLTEGVNELNGRRVFFLLDEFENLAEFQQTVVNTIVKLRPQSLTLKVATRARGVKSEVDLNREPIQTPRDYAAIPLDYDPESARYTALLAKICERRLASEGYTLTDVAELLPSGDRYQELGGLEAMERRVAELYSSPTAWSSLGPEKQREVIQKRAVAIIFRDREKTDKPRHYSGFSMFATLSSGIVSSFLELCKTSVYLAAADGVDVRGGKPVPPPTQNEAVYIASRTSLDVIVRNIPETGASINLLVRNLADVFRAKLLRHGSEPEAARIVITDPPRLGRPEHNDLERVLEDAVRWSVFHDEGSGAYLARRREGQSASEFVLNRMLVPVLKISHRYRWRTEFSVDELAALIDARLVEGVKARLIERHSGRAAPSGPSLFDSAGPELTAPTDDG